MLQTINELLWYRGEPHEGKTKWVPERSPGFCEWPQAPVQSRRVGSAMCLHSTPVTHPLQAHCLHESMPDSFSDFGLGNHLMTAWKQGLRWPYMEDKSPKTPINHSKRKGDTQKKKKTKKNPGGGYIIVSSTISIPPSLRSHASLFLYHHPLAFFTHTQAHTHSCITSSSAPEDMRRAA